MNTYTLAPEKQKLSGQLFDQVKAGLVQHPRENYVSLNCLYIAESGKLIPTYIHIASNGTVSVDSGWSSLSDRGNEPNVAKPGTNLNTPFGNFVLSDNKERGYPVKVELND